jgi:hypothetical protein
MLISTPDQSGNQEGIVQSHAERIWPDSGSAAPHDISQPFQKLWIVCVSPVPEVRGGSGSAVWL